MITFLDHDFSALNTFITEKKPTKIFILVDENTHTHCLPTLLGNLEISIPFEILEIESGEDMKNIDSARSLWEILLEYEADRKALLINLGGGVITDIGGFVASTFKRGIDFIHIPTTLLAMIDASIGGKTGIDLGFVKNIIGTFALPQKIFIYPSFLKTLPYEHLMSGLAEMLKHGIICDKSHWNKIIQLNEFTPKTLEKLIIDSMNIKQNIVENDQKENSNRKLLNFGHTLGHAIESYHLSINSPILHGFAVALGMMMESLLAYSMGILSKKDYEELRENLIRIYPFCKKTDYSFEALSPFLKQDKKNHDSQIGFVALHQIGKADYDWFLSESLIQEQFEIWKSINH